MRADFLFLFSFFFFYGEILNPFARDPLLTNTHTPRTCCPPPPPVLGVSQWETKKKVVISVSTGGLWGGRGERNFSGGAGREGVIGPSHHTTDR